MCHIHTLDLQKLSELQRIVSLNHSRPPHRILCILVSARTTLYPSSSQILYYYRVLMAQLRFVLSIENCVIRCNCVSKCCSLCYPVSSTFKIPSAWSSRHFCALPNNHILGPSENDCINCVFPPDWFEGSRWVASKKCSENCVAITAGPRFSVHQILPQMAESNLDNAALGLPKLSAVGLPMLDLNRFGDLRRQ